VSGGEICAVHLVWAPLGVEMLEGFLNAYRERQPGIEHCLAVIFNGFDGRSDRRLPRFEEALEGVAYEEVFPERALRDLEAYRAAAEQINARLLCFLNSYSRPLVDGWLSLLAEPHSQPAVGLTGIGGSYESAFSAAPLWLRRRRAADFAPFPNPHLRSNGFMVARELMLDLEWPALRSKPDAWALESGKRSISRQVWERGLEVLVVGRNAAAFPPERWRESATFRSEGQRNLLIADNRTAQYAQAKPELQRRLEEMAWGKPGSPAASRPSDLHPAGA
jgi:hypothetical protein